MYLIDKYKKMSLPVKASFWFVVCSVVQKGIAFIVTPIFTRILSADQYGVYNLYSTWLNIFTILITFNMSYGIFNNAMVKFEDDRDRYISSMQGLTLVTSLIALAIYGLFYDQINKLTGLSTFIMTALLLRILFTPAQNYWNAYQRYKFKYHKLIAVTLLIAFFTPILSVALIVFGNMQAEGRVLSALVIQMVVGGTLWIVQYKRGRALFVKEYWKFALGLGLPLVPHYLSQVILNSSDKIMISYFCGTEAVGYYSVAYSLGLVVQIFTNSINNSLIPWTYQQIKKEEYEPLKKVTNLIVFALACGILIFILFGPEVVVLMAPKEYHDARWVIPPVAGSVYFIFLYNIFGNVEFYFGKTKKIAFASTLCAFANVLLNAIFIPKFGYIVAGYTTLVCYIGLSCFHYYMMRKVCKHHMQLKSIYDDKQILTTSVIYIGVIAVSVALYNYTIIRYMFAGCLFMLAFCKRKVIMSNWLLIAKGKGKK